MILGITKKIRGKKHKEGERDRGRELDHRDLKQREEERR